MNNSDRLFARSKTVLPGGVNSPVRAFGAVGGTPRFIAKANGKFIEDVDGNRYLDFVNSWGPMILGHAHPGVREAIEKALADGWTYGAPTEAEADLAERICNMVPSVDKVRLVNSGTEATMSAIRMARAFTGRDVVIKFAGCYHGHHDAMLVAAGSGLATFGTPSSPGVTEGTTRDTVVCRYNDVESVQVAFDEYKNRVAAIIVEPIAGNMGVVLPRPGFLEALRELCDSADALLIFDEVITGFRLGPGGAQERLGITPDVTTLGKVIGGGLPVGAYGGRSEIMDTISPSGDVYQAGTLSGNPLAMAAGIATLDILRLPETYDRLEALAGSFSRALRDALQPFDGHVRLTSIGSMFTVFFSSTDVEDFAEASNCDTDAYARFFHAMLAAGFYFPPSQFETCFVSLAHDEEDASRLADAVSAAVAKAISN